MLPVSHTSCPGLQPAERPERRALLTSSSPLPCFRAPLYPPERRDTPCRTAQASAQRLQPGELWPHVLGAARSRWRHARASQLDCQCSPRDRVLAWTLASSPVVSPSPISQAWRAVLMGTLSQLLLASRSRSSWASNTLSPLAQGSSPECFCVRAGIGLGPLLPRLHVAWVSLPRMPGLSV